MTNDYILTNIYLKVKVEQDKIWELVSYVKIRRRSFDLEVTNLFTPEKQDMK